MRAYSDDTDEQILNEVQPRYIIMFEPNLEFVRRVEVSDSRFLIPFTSPHPYSIRFTRRQTLASVCEFTFSYTITAVKKQSTLRVYVGRKSRLRDSLRSAAYVAL